jgi:DNA-3-methyladenine glycosylase II
MARIIAQHPTAKLMSRGDAFTTLARAIVGQQISVKAAQSVWERVQSALAPPDPSCWAAVPDAQWQGLGLSARKIEYLQGLAQHFHASPGLAEELASMADEQVIDQLTAIRGIGRWTAEMALIFAFMRPDVLPLADLGLMKAISIHYRKGRDISAAQAQALSQRWQPWRSVATWYLWRSLDPEPVDY